MRKFLKALGLAITFWAAMSTIDQYSTAAPCVAAPAGLVSWWRGEGDAADSADGNPGVISGGVTFSNGVVGQSFVLNGVDGRIVVSNSPSLNFGSNQDFSIETWIRALPNNNDFGVMSIVDKRLSTLSQCLGYEFGLNSGRVHFRLSSSFSGNGVDFVAVGPNVQDGNFHHIAVTLQRASTTGGHLFVDGQVVLTFDATSQIGSLSNAEPFRIGNHSLSSFNGFFKGGIDEVSLYNRALSVAEIQAIYNGGAAGKCGAPPCTPAPPNLISWWRGEGDALDLTGTNNGVLVGNTTFGEGKVGQAFVFDGNGDGVIVGNLVTLQLQNFTIEAWLKRTSATTVTFAPSGGEVFSYGTGGYCLGMWDDGRLFLSKVDVDGIFSTLAVTDTNYHHVAVTKGGTSVIFYLDGISNAVAPYTSTFVFNTPAAIGDRGDNVRSSFYGRIDEVGVYERPLSLAEIQSIVAAGTAGKCLTYTAPVISLQPTNRTVHVGDDATFAVRATGTSPLTYQWQFNGADLSGQTTPLLTLNNIQFSNAGNYSVMVSNAARSVFSSNAVLIVNPVPPCTAAPTGIVSWWRGEGDALDLTGTNNGILIGNATFGTGKVGQGFLFDGSGDGVIVGNSTSLQLQSFTIEAWIRRSSDTVVTFAPSGGEIFSYGGGGYCLGVHDDGRLFLSKVDVDGVFSTLAVTDTNLHHVAVTKGATNVVFYLDGISNVVAPYTSTFVFNTPAAIGDRGDNARSSFYGKIDELSIYDRPLAPAEIQSIVAAGSAGKCVTYSAPVISLQPTNRTVHVGEDTAFAVHATGTSPLAYQWQFNGTDLSGQTTLLLVLNSIQFSNAGIYSVMVSNAAGPVFSSNAVLTVNPLPPCTAAPSGIVSWWKAENNTLDQAGTNNGVVIGNTAFAAGRLGRAFIFDGDGDGVLVGNPPGLQIQNFTIEAWIKRTSPTTITFAQTGGEIFSYGSGGYCLGMLDDGRIFLSKVDVDGVFSTLTVTDTNFHHVAVTKNGTNVLFFLDSVSDQPLTYDRTFAFTTPAAIGDRGDNVRSSFYGRIDEVSVYNRALTPSEIQAIYDADGAGKCPAPRCSAPPNGLVSLWRGEGNALDSVDSNPGLISGGVTFSNGMVGQSFVFNGVDGRVVVSNAPSLNFGSNQNFSIETWIRALPNNNDFGVMSIVDKRLSTFSQCLGYEFGLNSGRLHFRLSSSFSGNGVDFVAVGPNVQDGNFHHIAVTLERANTTGGRLFVDGQVVLTFDPTSQIGSLSNNEPFRIGNHSLSTFNGFFKGGIDEVSLYNRALTVAEIQAIYNAGSQGKCPPNHPPFAANMFAATRQNVSIKIPTDKLLAFATDADGDSLTVSSVTAASTNGGTVTLSSGQITYAPAPGFIGADRFTYTVSDGHGGFGSADISVQVRSADTQSGNMLPLVTIPGGFKVSFAGIPGRTYSLQRAPAVNGPWVTIASVIVGSDGIGTFSDTDSPPSSAFYRTVYP